MDLKHIMFWAGVCTSLYVAVTCDPNSDRYMIFECAILGYMAYIVRMIETEENSNQKKNLKVRRGH